MRATRDARSRRGSVLLMVVGVLTIIGMLGSAYVIFSRADAKQARSIAARNAADHLPLTVLSYVQEALANDLAFNPTDANGGPYSSTSKSFGSYIDCPIPGSGGSPDPWLASPAGEYPMYLSDFSACFPFTATGSSTFSLSAATGSNAYYADTDGDGVADALFVNSGVTNILGEEYWVAIRVIDTSGLINVNVAGAQRTDTRGTLTGASGSSVTDSGQNWAAGVFPTCTQFMYSGISNTCQVVLTSGSGSCMGEVAVVTAYSGGTLTTGANSMPIIAGSGWKYEVYNQPISPCDIDLSSLIGAGNYSTLHNNRSPGMTALDPFYINSGSRPLDVTGTYQPFATADEVLLRWGGAMSTSNYRLAAAYSQRSLLTTWNCSRSLLRYAQSGTSIRVGQVKIGDYQQTGARTAFSAALLGSGTTPGFVPGNTNDSRVLGAHLVANFWAYLQKEGVATDRACSTGFAVAPTSPAIQMAFGVMEQPVIAEGYAYSRQETATGSNDNFWGYAIELFNPTTKALKISDSNNGWGWRYAITINNVTTLLSGTANVIQPGCSYVLYSWGAGTNASSISANTFGFNVSDTGTWERVPELDSLDANITLRLSRQLYQGVTPRGSSVPLDVFNMTDIGYTVRQKVTGSGTPSGTNAMLCNGRRDNDMSRQRATIPIWKTFAIAPTGHKLGNSGGVSTTHDVDLTVMTANECLEGFPIRTWRAPNITWVGTIPTLALPSYGDLQWMYTVGPEASFGGSQPLSLPEALYPYRTNPNRGRFDIKSATVVATTSGYPDVPFPCLLPEIVEVASLSGIPGFLPPERQFGRININTAPKAVLQQLPWPSSIGEGSGSTFPVNTSDLADWIIHYRNNDSGYRPSNVRTQTNYPGFLTPGEIALPLAMYAENLMGSGNRARWWFNRERDRLYRAVANLVTVNSDTYFVYITVQLGRPTVGQAPKSRARYMAMLDRGFCNRGSDRPAVIVPLVKMD